MTALEWLRYDAWERLDPAEREAFVKLVRQANTPGWWHRYSDVLPGWFEMYVRLEQAASTIHSYHVQFVPGLLQTEAYARAVIAADDDGEPAARGPAVLGVLVSLVASVSCVVRHVHPCVRA